MGFPLTQLPGARQPVPRAGRIPLFAGNDGRSEWIGMVSAIDRSCALSF